MRHLASDRRLDRTDINLQHVPVQEEQGAQRLVLRRRADLWLVASHDRNAVVKKNGIMMVDFAVATQERGRPRSKLFTRRVWFASGPS
jgi:hypothetical protein